MKSRQVQLVEYPRGSVEPRHFRVAEVDLPDPGEGEVLVRNTFTSVDPGMRLRLRESGPEGYFNSFPLNAARESSTPESQISFASARCVGARA